MLRFGINSGTLIFGENEYRHGKSRIMKNVTTDIRCTTCDNGKFSLP